MDLSPVRSTARVVSPAVRPAFVPSIPSDEPRVLFVLERLRREGTFSHVLATLRGLRATHRFTVCHLFESDGPTAELEATLRSLGADVDGLGLRWTPRPARPGAQWRIVRALGGYLAHRRVAAIHLHLHGALLAGAVAASVHGRAPRVVTLHAPRELWSFRTRVLQRLALGLCDAAACVSLGVERSYFGTARTFEGWPPETVPRHCTIYNGVPRGTTVVAGSGARLRRRYGLGDGPLLLAVGRMERDKRQGLLIEAMPRIVRSRPDARLLLVGGGTLEGQLRRRARALGVADQVVFLGWLERGEVLRLLPHGSLLLLPSAQEGFGLAAAEAMAAGLPVVGFRLPGLAEVVEDGRTGVLLPQATAGVLADAALWMLRHPAQARAMGARGRLRVMERFTEERQARAYAGLYRRLAVGGDLSLRAYAVGT